MAKSTQSTPKKRPKFREWRPKFITALRDCGVVSYAAEQAGIDRSTAYKARDRNSRFKAEWDDALEEATDELEREARRRALDGVERMKIYKGAPVLIPVVDDEGIVQRDEKGELKLTPYVEREYSDTLMIFLLKAHRPDKFRDNVASGREDDPIHAINYIVENRPRDSDDDSAGD